MGAKPLLTMFDEIDGFINIYDRIRCLVLFAPESIMQFMTGLIIL